MTPATIILHVLLDDNDADNPLDMMSEMELALDGVVKVVKINEPQVTPKFPS